MDKNHQSKTRKPLEVYVYGVSDWDGFEKLIQFVEKFYHAEVIKKYDGPGARRWILLSQGKKFELIHDGGYGNYFLAPTQESEALVLTISKDIEQRLNY